jgi:hypothetical protein
MQKALEIKDHLRQDIEKADEPQLRAMFETSAGSVGRLIKAFRDYDGVIAIQFSLKIR